MAHSAQPASSNQGNQPRVYFSNKTIGGTLFFNAVAITALALLSIHWDYLSQPTALWIGVGIMGGEAILAVGYVLVLKAIDAWRRRNQPASAHNNAPPLTNSNDRSHYVIAPRTTAPSNIIPGLPPPNVAVLASGSTSAALNRSLLIASLTASAPPMPSILPPNSSVLDSTSLSAADRSRSVIAPPGLPPPNTAVPTSASSSTGSTSTAVPFAAPQLATSTASAASASTAAAVSSIDGLSGTCHVTGDRSASYLERNERDDS